MIILYCSLNSGAKFGSMGNLVSMTPRVVVKLHIISGILGHIFWPENPIFHRQKNYILDRSFYIARGIIIEGLQRYRCIIDLILYD